MTRPFAVEDVAPQPDLWRAKPAPPHYAGHRQRLRERALAGGLAALPDYEVLELFLFRSIPQGDLKPLAKQLLARFGSLGGVLGATAEELRTVKGVGESLALDLKLLHEADRNLIEPKTLLQMIDYIHDNPVRKGFVARACDWKWSSAGWFMDQRAVPLIPDRIPPEWFELD